MSVRVLEALKAKFGDAVLATHSEFGDDTAIVRAESWKTVCKFLRDDPAMAGAYGDGAGAAVLGPVAPGQGILDSCFLTDGAGAESMHLRRGGRIAIDGAATWQPVVGQLPATIRRVCDKAGVELADVDLFLFHQANLNLVWYVLRKLGQPLTKTHTNLEAIGNTGAASLAIVLSEAVAAGRLKPGDTLVLAAAGAGLTFGASAWKWAGA